MSKDTKKNETKNSEKIKEKTKVSKSEKKEAKAQAKLEKANKKLEKAKTSGNEKEYAVDIVPSSKLLSEKKPSNPEYERYKKIVNQYNKDKKGKEISFDMERVFCKSRKIFNDGFLNDKMDAYERSGECLRIKSGTKLRYEEIGDDLIVGYTVLSGSYKGKKLYGFQ